MVYLRKRQKAPVGWARCVSSEGKRSQEDSEQGAPAPATLSCTVSTPGLLLLRLGKPLCFCLLAVVAGLTQPSFSPGVLFPDRAQEVGRSRLADLLTFEATCIPAASSDHSGLSVNLCGCVTKPACAWPSEGEMGVRPSCFWVLPFRSCSSRLCLGPRHSPGA